MNVTTQPIIDHSTLLKEKVKNLHTFTSPNLSRPNPDIPVIQPYLSIKPYSKPDFDQMVRAHLQTQHQYVLGNMCYGSTVRHSRDYNSFFMLKAGPNSFF